MQNVEESIIFGAKVLSESEVAEPLREARSILAFVLGKDSSFLVAHPEYELTDKEENRLEEYLKRRANREPFQHITGIQEFWGLDFEVSKDVLIPRPETEMIVEQSIRIMAPLEDPTFCEVGIGSGCISISILHSVPNANGIGLDISEVALKASKRNAVKHCVFERLRLKQSDVFEVLETEKFDLIASNPPYIPVSEFDTLQPEVRDFDPKIALTDGGNGLSIIERIVINSAQFLKPGGFLLMEIGIHQAESIKGLFSMEIWQSIDVLPDLQGIPRTVLAHKF